MNPKQEHIKYRKIPFDCSIMKPVLSKEEFDILVAYGTWMDAIHLKKIDPITEKQRAFCVQIALDTPPKEKFALIFWKYLKRKELLKSKKLNNVTVKIKDDREDWKKIRTMRF